MTRRTRGVVRAALPGGSWAAGGGSRAWVAARAATDGPCAVGSDVGVCGSGVGGVARPVLVLVWVAHAQGTEVKAITYSAMKVMEAPGRVEIYVIVDI